jgi:hypothetical protein
MIFDLLRRLDIVDREIADLETHLKVSNGFVPPQ